MSWRGASASWPSSRRTRTRAAPACTSSSTPAWAGSGRAIRERRRAPRPPSRRLRLAGAMTHFATADEDAAFAREQLARFADWSRGLRAAHGGVPLHAANSAATLAIPESCLDMVRCGIAVYGMDPFGADPFRHGLRPALELRSYVAEVKRLEPGESVGYGRRFVAAAPTWIGTLPLGYGDGVRRALSNNCDVLVGGRRVPLVGTVSMDNVTVDLGPEPVERGAEAILIGAQGAERVLAEEWARRLGTINYEITCGISARVPREHHRDGAVVGDAARGAAARGDAARGDAARGDAARSDEARGDAARGGVARGDAAPGAAAP